MTVENTTTNGEADPQTVMQNTRPPSALKVVCYRVAVFSVALLALAALMVKLQYGSMTTAFAVWRGQVLVAEEYAKDVGRLQVGEIRTVFFRVKNPDANKVVILGAKTSCGCLAPKNLPRTLAPLEMMELELTIRARPREAMLEHNALLYTSPSGTPVVLRVAAMVDP